MYCCLLDTVCLTGFCLFIMDSCSSFMIFTAMEDSLQAFAMPHQEDTVYLHFDVHDNDNGKDGLERKWISKHL